ncbi:hypothetical protein [Poriferisphaera sp. WC338]|uniref:hypothetical protein n=1 Tax=Poriferisphaera sp. WC338 TaxID=3425129 RepID=UPI003D81C3CA
MDKRITLVSALIILLIVTLYFVISNQQKRGASKNLTATMANWDRLSPYPIADALLDIQLDKPTTLNQWQSEYVLRAQEMKNEFSLHLKHFKRAEADLAHPEFAIHLDRLIQLAHSPQHNRFLPVTLAHFSVNDQLFDLIIEKYRNTNTLPPQSFIDYIAGMDLHENLARTFQSQAAMLVFFTTSFVNDHYAVKDEQHSWSDADVAIFLETLYPYLQNLKEQSTSFDMVDILVPTPQWAPITRKNLGILHAAIRFQDQLLTQQAHALLAFKLRAHKIKTGSYPSDLASLKSDWNHLISINQIGYSTNGSSFTLTTDAPASQTTHTWTWN